MAIPWRMLAEAAPRRTRPRAGDQWRVNFSRVQWQLEVRDGQYARRLDPKTGKPLPEDNWVWSPQGAINMHTLLGAGDIRIDGLDFRPTLRVTDSLYELRAGGFDGVIVHLRQDGRVWITSKPR